MRMTGEATIVGTGSVGLALAARLARAGVGVLLVARRSEAASALSERGLAAVDAASGLRVGLAVRATTLSRWEPGAGGPIFACTRTDAVEAVAARAAGGAGPFVTFQNGVTSEAIAARHKAPVIGGVWRETSTRRADDCVCLQLERTGRAVLGLHPEGESAAVESAAALLRSASLDVSVSAAITRDKWLKLCITLMTAPNALVRRPDHRDAAFVEVKARLLEEAQAVLEAAGIDATPCDDRDRTLAQEIAFQRDSLTRGTSARPLPLYNHVWTGLHRGVSLEADDYHERIIRLGSRHGVRTPVNERVLACLREASRDRLGPECFAARTLLAG
jgi:2-dehydropantoate 2-reductase